MEITNGDVVQTKSQSEKDVVVVARTSSAETDAWRPVLSQAKKAS